MAGGQLYGDSDQAPPDLFALGSGTPTAAPLSVAMLPGLLGSGASPYGFVFFDSDPSVPGVDTLYVADDGTGDNGGIQKWTLVASPVDGGSPSWSEVWVTAVPAEDGGTITGFRGLAGYATGNTVTLMATTAPAVGVPNSLAVIVDTGTGTPAPSIVGTAYANETFRGVALPPHP